MKAEGRRRSGRRRREQGQATVELALVLPLAVLFALIVVQLGVIATDLVLVHHAAREGARAAAVEPTPDAARRAATESSALEPGRMTVRLGGGASRGDDAVVTVVYRAATSVPLVGSLVPDITLHATVTMRVE